MQSLISAKSRRVNKAEDQSTFGPLSCLHFFRSISINIKAQLRHLVRISTGSDMAASHPNMPAADPQTSYSFYPYPLGSITSTSLSGIAPSAQSQQSQAGPSRDRRAEIKHADKVRHRAELRALAGLRPAGFALGRDSEDLEVEETALDEERVSLAYRLAHRVTQR